MQAAVQKKDADLGTLLGEVETLTGDIKDQTARIEAMELRFSMEKNRMRKSCAHLPSHRGEAHYLLCRVEEDFQSTQLSIRKEYETLTANLKDAHETERNAMKMAYESQLEEVCCVFCFQRWSAPKPLLTSCSLLRSCD